MVTLSTSWKKLKETTVSISGFTGTFSLWAKVIQQDVANNRSKVGYDWDLTIDYGWVTSYSAQDYVSGAGWNDSAYREYTSSGTLRHGEEWITHNNDGTKTDSCSGRTIMGGVGIDTGWISESFTLPTIPRASEATANPNTLLLSNGTNQVTINTNRKSSSFTHTITLTCGTWSDTASNVTTSTTFAIPYTVMAQFAQNEAAKNCTITCVTYNGGTTIGTKTSSFVLRVDPSTDHPNVGTITVTDTNAKTSAVLSAEQFAYGISDLSASIPLTVSGDYTELAEAVVTCGSTTQTYVLSGTSQTITFTYPGIDVNSLTVSVRDTRGTIVTQSKTWTLLAYKAVTATATVGRPSATGSTAVGQVNGTAYGETYGATPNSLTITYEYKEHSQVNYTTGQDTYTQAIASGEQTFTQALTLAEAFDYQKEYDIRFTVSDLFSEATYTCRLVQGLPILSWDETEVDVWGNLHIHDRANPTTCQDVLGGIDSILKNNNKNLFVITNVEETTVTGVTFTPLTDGTVKANGTASAVTTFTLGSFFAANGVEYVLTGCPSGGGAYTYDLGISDYTTDTGNGLTFTGDGNLHTVSIGVFNGVQVNDLIFSPMIREAVIASDTFVPSPQRIYRANWTANNSSATGTQLTQKITIPKGLYAFELKEPFRSTTTAFTFTITLNGNATNFYVYSVHAYSGGIIYAYCPTDTEVFISSSNSASVSWTYTDRGWLKAIRIGG